ncbi:MAG: hypothetical protein LBI36_01825, partial [Oscillospiraceae bacterium]|nr:hypothetical protein [Oscillospiraceae bacterium]
MFDVKKYYDSCSNDDDVDSGELYQYLKTFENVILWGASFTGAAIGKKLLEEGVDFKGYWDLRADELCDVLDKPVSAPFSSDYARDKTMVIICIPNHVLQPQLLTELRINNYQSLRGDIIYSGICCKLGKKTGQGFMLYTRRTSWDEEGIPDPQFASSDDTISDAEIIHRLFVPMYEEAVRCFEEGIISDL